MIQSLLRAAKAYLPTLDEQRLTRAYEFAAMAHEGQLRRDGSPYIIHPVSAALILTGLHVDEDTLIACLLHDVPEDTTYTLDDVGERFGSAVRFLVDGITKLSKVHYRHDMESRQVDSLKKLFIHSAKDPRIILIKLADRLHNMRTIDAISKPEKRLRIAKETLEIFVPIANLLGIWEIKNELEDLTFRVLNPQEYERLAMEVAASRVKQNHILKRTLQAVKRLLRTHGIPFVGVEGRQKNIYSIYRKIQRKGKSFQDIHDLVGVRILVEDVGLCYQVLGILHQHFTPKIGRLKDYIAIPKSNGYQSIHTTVFGLDGVLTEFQIRTYAMHLEDDYGIAAHYFYSRGDGKTEAKTTKNPLRGDKKTLWVKRILDLQRELPNNKSFMDNLKLDIFEDRLFVFTPKGDAIDLPRGATVIDFAYHIHTELGMLATSALINGRRANLSTPLESGDMVYVTTSEESEGPQVEWLDFARTTLAKNRIREYLKEKDRTGLIHAAEEALDSRLASLGLPDFQQLSSLKKMPALEHFALSNWDDVFYDLGRGTLDLNTVLSALFSSDELENEVRLIPIRIQAKNRVGLIRDLSIVIAKEGVNIVNLNTAPETDPLISVIDFELNFDNFEHYERTLSKLIEVDGVTSVQRLVK